MTLVLIWLALSVVVAACVCRALALSGPGNPETAIYSESFSRDRGSLQTH
jgi:hypothetical protein